MLSFRLSPCVSPLAKIVCHKVTPRALDLVRLADANARALFVRAINNSCIGCCFFYNFVFSPNFVFVNFSQNLKTQSAHDMRRFCLRYVRSDTDGSFFFYKNVKYIWNQKFRHTRKIARKDDSMIDANFTLIVYIYRVSQINQHHGELFCRHHAGFFSRALSQRNINYPRPILLIIEFSTIKNFHISISSGLKVPLSLTLRSR